MGLAHIDAAKNIIALADKFSAFYRADAKDVTIEWVDEDGNSHSEVVPNVAKIKKELKDATAEAIVEKTDDDIISLRDGKPFKKILMYDATNDKNVYLKVDDNSIVIEDA